MTLNELIALTANRVPTSTDVAQTAQRLAISKPALCDLIAKTVAERFLSGALSWNTGDRVMNNLYAYALHSNDPDVEDSPPFARRVFEALDEGEYEHLGEGPEFQGEARTTLLLVALLTGDGEVPGSLTERARVKRVRGTAASIARRALDREVSAIVAARDLAALRHRVGVDDDDADFLVCVAIDSDTVALPIGPVRQHWAPDALAEKDEEIAEAEVWAMDIGKEAIRNIARRFGDAG